MVTALRGTVPSDNSNVDDSDPSSCTTNDDGETRFKAGWGSRVGDDVGTSVGRGVGAEVGDPVGSGVGTDVGGVEGRGVGTMVG